MTRVVSQRHKKKSKNRIISVPLNLILHIDILINIYEAKSRKIELEFERRLKSDSKKRHKTRVTSQDK
jgi:hypothetical protein